MTRGDNEAVLRWLSKGGNPRSLDLQTVDGRLDLRGLDARERPLRVSHKTLAGLDLSTSRLPGLDLQSVKVRDCVFDGADLTGTRVWQSQLEATSFRRAKMRDWVFSGRAFFFQHATTYTGCDFSGSDLRGSNPGEAIFTDCRFDNARLDKVEFNGSRLARCTFAGPMREVGFYGSSPYKKGHQPDLLTDIDFSRATFEWSYFKFLNLETVRYPDAPGHIVLSPWAPTLRCAIDALEHASAPNLTRGRLNLQYEIEWAGPRQRAGLLVVGEFVDEEVMEVLKACEAKCRAAGHDWVEPRGA